MVNEARVECRSDVLAVESSLFLATDDKNDERFGGDDMDSSRVVKFSNIEHASICMGSRPGPLSEPLGP